MEWLVPILFVLTSLVQWWMQRNRQGQEEELPVPSSPQNRSARPAPARRESAPTEEFGDLGELLEALGRRRHESPPPPVEQAEPPSLPTPAPQATVPPKRETVPPAIPEPVLVRESSQATPPPVFTAFPEAKSSPTSELTPAFAAGETPRVVFHPFPAAYKPGAATPHRWSKKLRSPESVREAVILSEILAPPVALR